MCDRLIPARTALLVIDVQQALFERRTPVYLADLFIENLNSLTALFQKAAALTVFIQHANDKILQEGTQGWHFHPDLHIDQHAKIIAKTHGNAFQETHLHEYLRDNGIDTVVISGLVTLGCVRATCMGAHELGYDVILVRDAHSSYHKSAAQRIQTWNEEFSKSYGKLCTTAELGFST